MTLSAEQLARPWWRQPSFVMLSLLMLSIVLYPFADYAREYRVMAQIVDIGIVLQVVHIVRAVGYWIGLGWLFAIPLVVLQIAALTFDATWIEPFLLTEMPRFAFPFIRHLIADLTAQAGFTPLYLTPVNFVRLYQQRMAKRTKKSA